MVLPLALLPPKGRCYLCLPLGVLISQFFYQAQLSGEVSELLSLDLGDDMRR